MELKIRVSKWSAGTPISIVHKKTAEQIGVHSGDRITITPFGGKNKEFSTAIDTMEKYVKPNWLVVSTEMKNAMGLKNGQKVEVYIAPPSRSLEYIKSKLMGKTLSEQQIDEIIGNVVSNLLSEAEISLFVSAMYDKGMSMKETVFLIKAILNHSDVLKWGKNKIVVDKHCIGGIAGNRTTPIVVSICAAAGFTMPKNSSRAITSAAGTADTMEILANVDFPMDRLKKIVNKTNACMVWGGALGMVPADSKIIQIEKKLSLDPEAQLLASIMSKKLAAGSKYILIDIPYGKSAKVNYEKGLDLKSKFEKLAKEFNVKMKVVLTKGNEPIGNGVGPALEIEDVLKVLDPTKTGPKDLMEKGIFLAGEIINLTGKKRKGEGTNIARNLLESGKAYEKFKEIISAQEGKIRKLPRAKWQKEILAQKSGKIVSIHNKRINILARSAGCPTDKFAGVYLENHVGYAVKKGEKLLTIYAESESRLKEAVNYYEKSPPIILK